MKRQVLDSGHWFDIERAECFDEDTYWNGRNRISRATGEQWNHEELYRTAGGRWIRHWWAEWQGIEDTWKIIEPYDAAKWFVRNGYEPHEMLVKEFGLLEIK